ncbi:carbohydrate ABC transporter membrane protein 1, CUT1 family [Faunimonas pinastri]|uniref:Carbohydrate ABC transporter membrane protein 1, CUT1 family n=1 Tax=Faunimonas pinastri TaxID=1855383 RepID=A0A1H9H039_9HYPH|nr:sugar ABC transporter permease [Faunimonas pinastri]SEQ55726.1 carbohydrate ABC transporter membrane protein 1, CUT1 family [Faunimonas pinastri]
MSATIPLTKHEAVPGPGEHEAAGATEHSGTHAGNRPKRSSRKGGRGGETLAALAFLAPNLVGFLCFTVLPIVASLVLSFYEWPIIGTPVFKGLGNFVKLFTRDVVFWRIVGHTLHFVVGYLILNLLISIGIAVWLTGRVPAKGFFRFVFFLPVLSPMVANAVVWRLLFAYPDGLIVAVFRMLTGSPGPNWLGSPDWSMSALIIMSVWAGFGYNMIIFVAGIEGIPKPLYEAARLDGAGPWVRFRHITLPLLTPSIFFATVMTLISSLQVFAQPYILTGGGPGSSTTTIVYYLYQNGFQNYEMGYASAIAWSLFILIMGVTAVQFWFQKKWVHYE